MVKVRNHAWVGIGHGSMAARVDSVEIWHSHGIEVIPYSPSVYGIRHVTIIIILFGSEA